MKSDGNFSRLMSSVSHDFAIGKSTTVLPTRFMNTSLPAKRNSFGNRTAWLSPFLNSLATFIFDRSIEYILIVYTSTSTSPRGEELREQLSRPVHGFESRRERQEIKDLRVRVGRR